MLLLWGPRSLVGRDPDCRCAGLTQGNRTIQFGILDGSVFLPLLTSALPSLYLARRMSNVAFGRRCGLAPLILLPLAILRTFRLDHPRRPFFSYDNLLFSGRLGLRWPNQNLLPFELDRVHICRERVLVELHLGTLYKFQSSFVYGRLNLSVEDIAIVSSIRIRIMPFTICMLFELFWRWYDVTTWQFNLLFL
jgi:hypothetical protein